MLFHTVDVLDLPPPKPPQQAPQAAPAHDPRLQSVVEALAAALRVSGLGRPGGRLDDAQVAAAVARAREAPPVRQPVQAQGQQRTETEGAPGAECTVCVWPWAPPDEEHPLPPIASALAVRTAGVEL